MAHHDEIKIKGAAQDAQEPAADDAPTKNIEDQPEDTAAKSSVKSTEAEEVSRMSQRPSAIHGNACLDPSEDLSLLRTICVPRLVRLWGASSGLPLSRKNDTYSFMPC